MKNFFITLGLGAGVAFVTLALFFAGTLDGIEETLRDRLFVTREAPEDVIIIAIDEKSLAAIGRWPWDRKVHAALLNLLAEVKPKVVGIDINFAEPQDEENDALLERAIERLRVVLPVEAHDLNITPTYAETRLLTLPLARFQRPNTIPGHVNVPVDDDGVARKIPIAIRTRESVSSAMPAFGLSIWRAAAGPQELSLKTPTLRRINYLGPPSTFKTVSYQDALSGEIPSETFRDKIVLIGVTAPDLRDTLVTPTSRGRAMAGVEVHANIFEMIRRDDFLRDAPGWIQLLLIVAPALAFALLVTRLKKLPAIIGATGIFVIVLVVTAALLFDQGFVAPLVYPPLALFGTFAATTAFRYTAEAKEKRWIRQTFQYYLSPAVIEELIRDPEKLKLGGELREVTVLFSDIRGFTTWSEKLKPEELVPLLNEYLTAMTEVILAEDGVLDKYIGDAVMAFWGAPLKQPDHALRAVRAATGMKKALEALNARWQARGIAGLKNGIGIATGAVIVGNMGSIKRFDYTIIGDTVNTASRLEYSTKELGEQIVFSETTAEKIKDVVSARPLGEIMVKGKERAVRVYTLQSLNPNL